MSVSKARALLAEAASERARLKRHFLVGAALTEVLSLTPVVVGGTAEEFYTQDEYHETDLDLCGRVTPEEEELLVELGFQRLGRHWFHLSSEVAVEFPEERIDGDEARIRNVPVGTGGVAIIGLDDLFVDRLRQATASTSKTSVEFKSALAVAGAAYDTIDWGYVDRVIQGEDRPTGERMLRIKSQVLRTVRRRLATPTGDQPR